MCKILLFHGKVAGFISNIRILSSLRDVIFILPRAAMRIVSDSWDWFFVLSA